MADFSDSLKSFFGRRKQGSGVTPSDESQKRRYQLVEALTEEERKRKKDKNERIDPQMRFGKNISDILGGKVKKP